MLSVWHFKFTNILPNPAELKLIYYENIATQENVLV